MVLDDLYYSKSLNQYFPTRLDYLLYAHDGRGLGHVSRTVAVGIALKRLDPEAKVLVVTGSGKTGMLIGPAPLDWIKLPSYQTTLKNGVPTGGSGDSGYYKSVLGKLRSHMLKDMVRVLKPRCVLVDHNPRGKREELLGALQESRDRDTKWVFGIRGIVGDDPSIWSKAAAEAVDYYEHVLWYGDKHILGTEQIDLLAKHFKRDILEVGYVSRLLELKPFLEDSGPAAAKTACTVSLPWLGESGETLLTALREAVDSIDTGGREYHIYVPSADEQRIKQLFSTVPQCTVRRIGDRYITSLLNSDSALIYGGYNSLLDVTAAGIPAVVVLRSTRDGEQLEHLKKLQVSAGNSWQVIAADDLDAKFLRNSLQLVMNAQPPAEMDIGLDGSGKTASFLRDLIEPSS